MRDVCGLEKPAVEEPKMKSAQASTGSHGRKRESRKPTRSGSWELRG